MARPVALVEPCSPTMPEPVLAGDRCRMPFAGQAPKVGARTTLRVYLRRADDGATAVPARQTPAGREGAETNLLVEDAAAVREMTRTTRGSSGYAVLEAANGVEALAVAEAHPGQSHLLITDLVMLQLSGREMSDWLRPIRPGLRDLYSVGVR